MQKSGCSNSPRPRPLDVSEDVSWSWSMVTFDNLEGAKAPDIDLLATEDGPLNGV